MTIPQSKYVAITSTVAKTAGAAYKELIARVFTTNPLFPANTVLEFSGNELAQDVANYAGATSQEAKIASEYAGWVSKRATKPQKISFMRYSFTALAPYIRSTYKLPDFATFKAVSTGSMVVNMGGTSYTISGVDFSSATSFADVASALQTKIRSNTSGGALWTSATVTYDATTNSLLLTGGQTGAANITYATASDSGVDISALVGWSVDKAPVLSVGTAAASITDILNKTIDISTNFLTFGFVSASDAYDNLDAIGKWVQAQNNNYRFCFDLSSSNYATGIAIANKYEGMTAHYNINYGISGINPAWLMSAILPATTNYNKPNGVKNYMFQEFPQQAVSVGLDGDGTLYQTLDGLNINYNGQTQKSGAKIAFYQNGFNADGTDSAIFDNEAWLKDAIATDVLNAFLGLDFISADKDGEAIIAGILDTNADKALNNHVFANGRVLNNNEKAFITQLFADENAWLDVQNNGYKYLIDITTQTNGGTQIHVADYTLCYLKNDVIRKVTGSNILV